MDSLVSFYQIIEKHSLYKHSTCLFFFTLGWFGDLAGFTDGAGASLTFQFLLGKLFIPIAFLMGTPSGDVDTVARLIGEKVMITEFPAYAELGTMIRENTISPRGATIATFALCGFANVGSIGVQLGGLGAMAPERKSDLAQVAFRAFIAGCLTSFINACVAGALISDFQV